MCMDVDEVDDEIYEAVHESLRQIRIRDSNRRHRLARRCGGKILLWEQAFYGPTFVSEARTIPWEKLGLQACGVGQCLHLDLEETQHQVFGTGRILKGHLSDDSPFAYNYYRGLCRCLLCLINSFSCFKLLGGVRNRAKWEKWCLLFFRDRRGIYSWAIQGAYT